jgi:two-component system, sensor histidine kinase YesM
MRTHWLHKIFLHPFLNIRLRSKLFIILCIVSILPLLCFVYYSYSTTKRDLIDQAYQNMINTTAQINVNLENKLESLSKISASLYLDQTLRDYLIRDYTDNVDYLEAYTYFNNIFNNVLTTNPDIQDISIFSPNPSLPLDNVYIKKIDQEVQNRAWYKAVQATYGNTIYISTPAQQATVPLFSVSRLLNNNSLNFPYGILTIDIAETNIYTLMEKENKDKTTFISDQDGTILSSKNKNLLNRNLNDLLHHQIGSNRDGSFNATYADEPVLVVYSTLTNGWKTVSLLPFHNILKNVQLATLRIIYFALISTFFAAILIYLTARLLTKRIEHLLQLIRRVEREDFSTPFRNMGHDEIGQLAFAFDKMSNRLKVMINEVYKKELLKKDAELQLLQSQINPHFLYNTLASISALSLKQEDTATHNMVAHLAKFYRISLNKGKSIITLNEEIKLTENYIAIQQIRFHELIHLHYQIEDSVRVHSTVKLTLQPFVENCINHALCDDELGINIVIKAFKLDSDIILEVIDDGMGMLPEVVEQLGQDSNEIKSYGISNVDKRIKLAFGEEYGVSIYSKLGIGTKVSIRIPQKGVM